MKRLRGLLVHGALFVALLVGLKSQAQDAPVLTLHVYENLIQIPVLVLSDEFDPIAPVASDRFTLSVDSGPRFRPKHVRLEGDDPISLSILINVSGNERELLKKIGPAIAKFGRTSLHSGDRLSIYVEDYCEASRVVFNQPPGAPDFDSKVDLAIEAANQASRTKNKPGCKPEEHLWDALTYVVAQSATLSGRRVVLALADGDDRNSKAKWTQVRALATRNGVAIFGLQAAEVAPFSFSPPSTTREDAFRQLCELSGGLVFTATHHGLSRRLQQFADLLRKRYIVEFPRPGDLTKGDHDFLVSISELDAFIRPAGISVPIADPKAAEDPNVLRPASPAPVLGDRKILPVPPQ